MAKKYAENGPKKLDWASNYLETSSHDNVTEKNVVKGMFSRKEILDLEGVDVDGVDEKTKEAILKEVLDELYKRLGLDVTKNPELFKDHKIHQLKKYYYESTPKVHEKEIDQKGSQMQIEATGLNIGFAHKMLTDAPASGSAIKVENPHHVQLMNKVKAVMQAKTRLEKEETALKDIFAELETSVKVEGKPASVEHRPLLHTPCPKQAHPQAASQQDTPTAVHRPDHRPTHPKQASTLRHGRLEHEQTEPEHRHPPSEGAESDATCGKPRARTIQKGWRLSHRLANPTLRSSCCHLDMPRRDAHQHGGCRGMGKGLGQTCQVHLSSRIANSHAADRQWVHNTTPNGQRKQPFTRVVHH